MKNLIFLLIGVAILFYFWFTPFAGVEKVSSTQIEAIIDSIYGEHKITVATMVFSPKVRYTQNLYYKGRKIPYIGSHGFRISEGYIEVGLGYDLKKNHRMVTIDSIHTVANHTTLYLVVHPPQAVSMDCRAPIRWDWSVFTGQPTSEFAYRLIEKELFAAANEQQLTPTVLRHSQDMIGKLYTDILLSMGYGSVSILFSNSPPHTRGDVEVFEGPLDFEWQQEVIRHLTDEEARQILGETPGNVWKQIREYTE